VGDELADPEKTYQAAFVTSQGVPENFGKNRKHIAFRTIEALKQYCLKHPIIDSTTNAHSVKAI
jgi:sulfur-oxidizing protein SoxB